MTTSSAPDCSTASSLEVKSVSVVLNFCSETMAMPIFLRAFWNTPVSATENASFCA